MTVNGRMHVGMTRGRVLGNWVVGSVWRFMGCSSKRWGSCWLGKDGGNACVRKVWNKLSWKVMGRISKGLLSGTWSRLAYTSGNRGPLEDCRRGLFWRPLCGRLFCGRPGRHRLGWCGAAPCRCLCLPTDVGICADTNIFRSTFLRNYNSMAGHSRSNVLSTKHSNDDDRVVFIS